MVQTGITVMVSILTTAGSTSIEATIFYYDISFHPAKIQLSESPIFKSVTMTTRE